MVTKIMKDAVIEAVKVANAKGLSFNEEEMIKSRKCSLKNSRK